MNLSRHVPLILFALLYSLTALATGFSLAHGLLAIPLIWISVADLDRHVIPDTATMLVAGFGLLIPLTAGRWPDAVTVAVAVLAVAVLALAGEVCWRRQGVEALGLGDAKLIGAGVLVVGAERVWLMILLAAAGGIVAALMASRRAERGIPFGPFLAYAIFAVTTFAGEGMSW
jgi:prepilin signal peptidase PulO-like enzyme (type II secretory pathway)